MGDFKMKRAVLSSLLAVIFIMSIAAPALASNPSIIAKEFAKPSVKSTVLTKTVPPKADYFPVDKIDRAIMDAHYMRDLAGKYATLFSKVYHTNNPSLGVFVKIKDMNYVSDIARIASRFGGKIVKSYPEIDTVLIAFPADPGAIAKFSKIAAGSTYVEKITLDKVAQPAMWDTTILLGAYNVWNTLGINGSGTLVAILDTGIDPTNPAVPDPAYWRDFINNQSTPYDDVGHGTHVSGTVAGNGPSIFNTTTGMWHAVLVGQTGQFNYIDKANLTYAVNVTGYGGSNVTLNVTHLYILLDTSYASYGYIFAAGAYIYYRFDNGNWTLLASFSGNQTTPVTDSYNITVPANATTMEVSFIYDYLAAYINGTIYLSHWDIDGWFIDKVVIYNATNSSQVLLYDDVSTLTPPPNVVTHSWWVRTPSQFHGIAPGAQIAMGKVCGTSGCPYSAILDGMEWAYNISADVVSMSLGGTAYSYDPIAQMADWLVEHGIVVVIAAGNSGPDYYTVESPGISHEAITVAAATKAWTTAYFSSTGPSPVDYYPKPDVSAPGMAVSSTVPMNLGLWAPDFPYEAWAGTSMATPHVAGLAALIKSAHPTWTPYMIKSAIISTADWLYPNVYFPYAYDIYKQGAGMIDPMQAVTTTVIPEEANMFLGTPVKYIDNSTEYNITLINLGSTPAQVNITDIDLYWTSANISHLSYQDWDTAVQSPSIGDSYIIPPNGTVTITLYINLTNTTMPTGPYGGHITFSTNTSGTIKVIYGFTLLVPVWINGTVIDYDTGKPIANVNVSAWTPYLDSLYGWNVTDSNGEFHIRVPSNTTIRLVGEDLSGTHYLYISYPFDSDGGAYLYIYMKERVTQPTILIVPDAHAAPNVTKSIAAMEQAAAEAGLPFFLWNPAKLGTIYGPVLSGDFPVIAYFSGGYYYPISDAADYTALYYYSIYYNGLIILSGGDIGWFHDNDALMVNVAHAKFYEDMWPDTYNVTLLKHPLTVTFFGPENYLEYYNASDGTPIGNITAYYISGYWPDRVLPENGGVTIGNWSDQLNTSAIVVYDGSGNTTAKTVYFAFDTDMLNESVAEQLLMRALAFYYDQAPPAPKNDAIISIDYPIIKINATNAFQDDFAMALYKISITSGNTTLYTSAVSSPVFTINATEIGLTPGNEYNVTITGVDLLGKETPATATLKLYSSTKGASVLFLGNTTAVVPGVTRAEVLETTMVSVNITAPATVQIVKFPDNATFSSVLGVPLPAKLNRLNVYMDVYVKESTSGAVQKIVLKFYMNTKWVKNDDAVVLWYDGTTWRKASNVTADPKTGEIDVVITNTTSPSISDLTGTPVILSAPAKIVGGSLALPEASTSFAVAVMALTAALAVAVYFSASREE